MQEEVRAREHRHGTCRTGVNTPAWQVACLDPYIIEAAENREWAVERGFWCVLVGIAQFEVRAQGRQERPHEFVVLQDFLGRTVALQHDLEYFVGPVVDLDIRARQLRCAERREEQPGRAAVTTSSVRGPARRQPAPPCCARRTRTACPDAGRSPLRGRPSAEPSAGTAAPRPVTRGRGAAGSIPQRLAAGQRATSGTPRRPRRRVRSRTRAPPRPDLLGDGRSTGPAPGAAAAAAAAPPACPGARSRSGRGGRLPRWPQLPAGRLSSDRPLFAHRGPLDRDPFVTDRVRRVLLLIDLYEFC